MVSIDYLGDNISMQSHIFNNNKKSIPKGLSLSLLRLNDLIDNQISEGNIDLCEDVNI